LVIKPNQAESCPLCWWALRAAIGWSERGAIVESIAAGAARSLVIGGVERAVVRSTFSNLAKSRIISAFRKTNKASEAYDLINKLDELAMSDPNLVALHNKYENEIVAWWATSQSDNSIIIKIKNTNKVTLDSKLKISFKDKETSEIEKSLNLLITAHPKASLSLPIRVSNLAKAGVKDIVIEIDQPNIHPIIKTIFVV
jgi:hypothetical protein